MSEPQTHEWTFSDCNIKIFYEKLVKIIEEGEEDEIIKIFVQFSDIIDNSNFRITKLFDDFNILQILLGNFHPDIKQNIRDTAFDCLQSLLSLDNLENFYCFKIIETLAPYAAVFDFPHLEQVHILLFLSMKNQECQQHLFACPDLLFDEIASIITHTYNSDDQAKAAFLFVGSTFNFGTSELYATTIIEALKSIQPSEYKSYIIFKIVTVMPEMVSEIGPEITFQSIYQQLESEDKEQIIQALSVLESVTKYTKGDFSFDFGPVFAKLDADDQDIPSFAYHTLSTLANLSVNGCMHFIENGIFQRCVEEAQNDELQMKRRIECVRLIALILHKVESTHLLELINMDIVHLFSDFLQVEDPLFCTQILSAIHSIFSANSEELSNDTTNLFEEEGTWNLIQDFTTNQDKNLAIEATNILSDFVVGLPDDDFPN